MPSRLKVTPNPYKMHQRGQSLVEFALSSVVLLLLLGGLVDIGRAIYVTETLSNAAREGARHGAWFDAPRLAWPYLNDAQIKSAVDQELVGASMQASVLKSGCPGVADGNAYHNPPYVSSAYPPTADQAWLYICYANTSGPPALTGGQDLNVIVLFTYSPLTPLVSGQFGTFRLAANQHFTVQGP